MLTEIDHINNLKLRLQELLKEKEREVQRIQDTIATLEHAPNLLKNLPVVAPGPKSHKPPTRVQPGQPGVAQAARVYVAGAPPGPITVPEVMNYLKGLGIDRAYRSLYSHTRQILQDEVKKGRLTFSDGTFTKPGREPESTLVYSDEGGKPTMEKAYGEG